MTTFVSLCRDWATLVTSAPMTQAVRRWAHEDEALAAFANATELVAYVERRGHPMAADRVLACLARRAPTDELAARTLLQLLLPGLGALARRHRWLGEPGERAQAVVAVAYERIRTYPFERRPQRIAANVLADTLQRLLAERDRQRREPPPADGDDIEGGTSPYEVGEPTSSTHELLGLLSWAGRSGHLDAQAVRLIALTRVADVAPSTLVPEFGSNADGVLRRRHRAESRLGAAVRAAVAA